MAFPSDIPNDDNKKAESHSEPTEDVEYGRSELQRSASQTLHRKLGSKEVQLFAIGGAIGTSLYVQMGAALPKGGPAGLLIGFLIWGAVMLCVNECFAEMVCYAPIPSPFTRLGGYWVDEALGFAMSWNFFLNMALLVPFEIVAFNILLSFWTDAVPVEAVVVVVILVYALLNIASVKYFGVAEFYLSIFKVFLILMCLAFTFVTMLGGNPLHDRYGFRHWNNPVSLASVMDRSGVDESWGAFVEHLVSGSTGRFLGVLSCIVQATFSITGPEYIAMVAGETAHPHRVLPKAYRSFVWRILLFFLSSSLAMGIVIPYNDSTLNAVLDGKITGSGTGAASPYVIAMTRLRVTGLPHLVNALIMTSVLSSGNGIFFAATRTLYGMAVEGTAPKFFSKTLNSGVPYFAVTTVIAFSCLAFLQASNSSAKVLTWLVDLVTACQLLNYFAVALTYRHFYAAVVRQNHDRRLLPYRGKFQPYCSYVAMFGCLLMLLLLGFDLFVADGWSIMYFFLDYTFLAAFPLAVLFWKVLKATKYVKPGTADLTVGGLVSQVLNDDHGAEKDSKARSRLWARIFNRDRS